MKQAASQPVDLDKPRRQLSSFETKQRKFTCLKLLNLLRQSLLRQAFTRLKPRRRFKTYKVSTEPDLTSVQVSIQSQSTQSSQGRFFPSIDLTNRAMMSSFNESYPTRVQTETSQEQSPLLIPLIYKKQLAFNSILTERPSTSDHFKEEILKLRKIYPKEPNGQNLTIKKYLQQNQEYYKETKLAIVVAEKSSKLRAGLLLQLILLMSLVILVGEVTLII